MKSCQIKYLFISFLAFIVFTFFIIAEVNGQKTNRYINAFCCSSQGHEYLVVHQSIFEPVSRTYEQGNLRSSGYNTSEIVIYNLADGQIVAQKKLGRIGSEEHTLLLGYSNNIIWAYSLQNNQGFIGYTVPNLDTKTTFGLYIANRDWKNKLYKNGINNLNRYFSFDHGQNRILFTDSLMSSYSFDPFKYDIIKATIDFKDDFRQKDYLTDEGSIGLSKISLTPGDQSCIMLDKKGLGKPQCLNGASLIKVVSKQAKTLLIQGQIDFNKFLINQYNHQVDSLMLLGLKSQTGERITKISGLNEEKDFYIGLLSQLPLIIDTFEMLLTTQDNSFFALSNSLKPHEGILTIHSFRISPECQVKKKWETQLEGIPFLNYKTGSSDQVQKTIRENEPDFDFTFFMVNKNYLIGFFALNIFVIDTNSGELVWKIKN